ncbi:TIGR01621 family pseudouridine synthase [Glaciecola sp. 1036]|uniref:TIGR01621 family pseudouridine synthase n=1 Tax=Alteromonadaceae TaxID=72275 RepID=UPI003D056924
MLPICLYEDQDFLAVYKPVGIQMHDPVDGIIPSVVRALELTTAPLLIHRLDQATSGVLLLGKNPTSTAEIAALFAQKAIHKHYIALSDKKPKKKQGQIIGDMQKARNGSYKLQRSKDNPAVTEFTSSSVAPGVRIYHLHPKTGKTHQLRVALKSLGSPILGDKRYSGTLSDRMYLHALSINFVYKNKSHNILAPLCEGEHWENSTIQTELMPFFEKASNSDVIKVFCHD